MMPVRSFWFAILILAWPALLNAQAADSGRLFLNSRWRPPAGQRCFPGTEPVPALDAVFDSSAVAAGLQRPAAGSYVISVNILPVDTALAQSPLWRGQEMQYDSTAVVELAGDSTTGAAISSQLRTQIRRRSGETQFLLRVDVDSVLRFRTAPGLFCPPSYRDESRFRRALAALSARGVRLDTRVAVLVRSDGTVASAHLVVPSDQPEIDTEIMAAARQLVFHPGTFNRVPMPWAVRVPVSVH